MLRAAFKMRLKPGMDAVYQKRHRKIWPALVDELKAAGIEDYSIFLDDETGTLFAVQKLNRKNTVAELPDSPLMRQWWDFMAPLMETLSDHSPVVKPLREVFHLD